MWKKKREAAVPEGPSAAVKEAEEASGETLKAPPEALKAPPEARKEASPEQAAEKDLPEETNPLKKAARKIAGVGTAGLAAVSLFIGSIFSSPSEILQKKDPDADRPAVVIEYQAQPEDGQEEAEEEGEEKKKSLRTMIRNFILGLPVGVKLFLILPLWIVGYGLIAMLTALFEPVIAPVLSAVLKWMLIGGMLLLALFLVKKSIAPNTPLREIFSKRNVVLAGVSAAVLGTGDFFLKAFVEGYTVWRNAACIAAGAVLLLVFTVRQLTKKKKAAAA